MEAIRNLPPMSHEKKEALKDLIRSQTAKKNDLMEEAQKDYEQEKGKTIKALQDTLHAFADTSKGMTQHRMDWISRIVDQETQQLIDIECAPEI